MQNAYFAAGNNQLGECGISDLLISIVFMIFTFVVLALLGLDTSQKLYDALAVTLIYLPAVVYLYNKKHIDIQKEFHEEYATRYLMGALWILSILVLISVAHYFYASITTASVELFSYSSLKVAIYYLLACIAIPICEEIIFRYYFFTILKNRYGLYLGGILSILLFVAVHYFNPITPVLVFQGWLFTYVYYKTNSIFSSISLHILNNSVWHFIIYMR